MIEPMNSITISSIPTISTTRVTLRPFSLTDAREVQRMAGNIKIAQMTGTVPHPYLDGMAETWISKHADNFANGDGICWAIEDANSKKLVGCISFMLSKAHKKAEAGYWVGEEFWGKGYCTEAMNIGIEFSFKHFDLNKITSRHLAQNPASGKVMIKAGMTQEGFLKQEIFRHGSYSDLVVYGLLRSEWERS